MNYIAEIKAFYDLVQVKQLSTGQIALWNALMYINNKCAWIEWFTVPNILLELNTGMSRSGVLKARNSLKQYGLIDFKANGTKASTYKINTIAKSTQESNQSSVQDSTQDSTQDGKQDGVQDGNTLNKLNETKQYIDHFELIWDKYPNKQGKAKALEYYLQWIKGRKISTVTRKLTDRQMYYAVVKYAKECEEKKIEQQFIKHGDTFFNKAILDYVEVENEQVSGD